MDLFNRCMMAISEFMKFYSPQTVGLAPAIQRRRAKATRRGPGGSSWRPRGRRRHLRRYTAAGMSAGIPAGAGPVWFLGTADGTQSCNTVCQTIAIDKCGPSHDQRCALSPVCMEEPLEKVAFDSSCDLARAARSAAGDPTPINHCSACIVADWGTSIQAANCQPGIATIMDSKGEHSFYFTGRVASDPCS
eukprot:COSAG01_NODE_25080_length_756_cov_1.913242_1_plen_190_part_01